MTLELLNEYRCFSGVQQRYQHQSASLNCDMTFSIFMPPQSNQGPVPVIYWLSGLTCTDENFVQKAGAQRAATQWGVAIVAPDTSPRGDQVADDPEGAYDLGLGAGFYVNANQQPWSTHYQMYSYCTQELPDLINAQFNVDANQCSIMGHSMGGHGALTLALRNPQQYKSASAFAPICAPSQCPWGEKALVAYLGDDPTAWRQWDTTALIETATDILPMRLDFGLADEFLDEQLKPDLFRQACAKRGFTPQINEHEGYDHSYFFIASFIDAHIAFHAQHLGLNETN